MPLYCRPHLFLLIFSVFLSGCNVISSYRVTGEDAKEPRQNSAGSYFLPKHLLVATVNSKGIAVVTEAVQDRSTLLQTGLNLSGLSHDTITVAYSGGLLSKITSINDDKTGEILTELAKAAGRFRATGDKTVEAEVALVVEFDPFNAAEAATANKIIGKRYPGTCVEVELLPGIWSAGCGKHSLGWNHSSPPGKPDIRTDLGPVEPGIYYKRSLDHRVHTVFKNRSVGLITNKFANIAPIFRIDINRTLFVKRNTEVDFTEGELTSVMVDKPSEVLAIAKLPVAMANAYISGIVDGFTQRKGVQSARATLLTQQASTLKAEQALIEAQIEAALALKSSEQRAAALQTIQRSTSFRSAGTAAPAEQFGVNRSLQDVRDCQQELGLTTDVCLEFLKSQSQTNRD